jgi:hypothetical protein
MDRFVARENMRHFHGRLETEADSNARSLLHRLLVQEEDKLGHDREALREIENHLARTKEHVNRQQALVASIECDGHDSTHALVLLTAYSEILLAYENQRRKLLVKLQHSSL